MKEEQLEKFLQKLQARDPLFELRVEFGKLLLKHINDLTPVELEKYKELQKILSNNPYPI